ncbi:Ig-like domain-containing protein [Agilicoccus flavus]|uniref:Ig-like domain-containing protein n=1 Tax=Agilicoccus flavus TaxID=2775968 RepID=UPI001CF6B22D|nr:Ig-like domain-containing protein [Agilicoccus flavus]
MSVIARLTRFRSTGFTPAAVTAGLLCLPTVVVAAWPADAAEVPGAITDVDLVATESDVSDQMRLAVNWAVPDQASVGDSFTLTLPPELQAVDGMRFDLRDGTDVVARAVVTGRTVTFTLTDFVDTHTDVHGSAWFGVTFARTVRPGDTLDLEFTSDGVVFRDSVRVTGVVGDYSQTATKWQAWADPARNSPPRPEADRIIWALNGPRVMQDWSGTTYTFTDTPGPGSEIDCDTISVFWGTTNSGGVAPQGWYGPDRYTTTCAPDKLTLVLRTRADDVGHIPGVLGWSRLSDPDLKEYRNSGTVELSRAGTWPIGHVLRVEGGGVGTGRTPVPTTAPASPVPSEPTTVPTVTSTPTGPDDTPTVVVPGTPEPTATAPATTEPATDVPTQTAPATSVPTGTAPATSVPTGTAPATSVPTGTAPAVPTSPAPAVPTAPATRLPTASATSVPAAPATSVPTASETRLPTASATSVPIASATRLPTAPASVAPARPAPTSPTRATPVSGATPSVSGGSPSRIDTGVPAQPGADGRLVAGGLALVGVGGIGLLLAGRRKESGSARE